MLDAVDDPLSMKFLCEQIKTEILFYVLCGSCGKAFIQSITSLKSAGEIYEGIICICCKHRKDAATNTLSYLFIRAAQHSPVISEKQRTIRKR